MLASIQRIQKLDPAGIDKPDIVPFSTVSLIAMFPSSAPIVDPVFGEANVSDD